jgi:hypothetical protein
VELHKQLCEAGPGAIYCDTDGVRSLERLTRRIGPGLGEWKDEGRFTHWRAWAPKLYVYWKSGKATAAAKGLSGIQQGSLAEFAAGLPWIVESGVAGLATAARKGGSLFTRQRLERTCHADGLHFGSRILGPDGVTRARSYEDLTGGSVVVASEFGEEGGAECGS